MKITRLETLRLDEFPNLVWLRVHTDQGLAGLGETSFAARSVEAYLHEFVAPRVLGRDPLEIEALTRSLSGYLGWRGSGVETRPPRRSISRSGTCTARSAASRSTKSSAARAARA